MIERINIIKYLLVLISFGIPIIASVLMFGWSVQKYTVLNAVLIALFVGCLIFGITFWLSVISIEI